MKSIAQFLSRLAPALCFVIFFAPRQVFAQATSANPSPYASLDRAAVSYSGPGRASASDLPGNAVTLGLLLPLHGEQAAESSSLLAAAQLAVDDAQSSSHSRVVLAIGDESERWGQAGANIVQLVQQENAIALITLFNGDIAHQAEQIANKLGVPVLTFAGDPTITEINIPWIFRFGPSDTDQARAIIAGIATLPAAKTRSVLFISGRDHDGRIARNIFHKLWQELHPHIEPSVSLDDAEVDPADAHKPDFLRELIRAKRPDVIILYSDAQTESNLFAVAPVASHPYLFVSQKAAQLFSQQDLSQEGTTFNEKFIGRTNHHAFRAAVQLYRAIRILVAAIDEVGPNRARLRDYLANGQTFDSAGNFVSPTFPWMTPSGRPVTISPSEAATRVDLPLDVLE